jgi:hypothetical protein
VRTRRQRLPPGDGARALPRLHVIGDTARFCLPRHSADGGSLRFGDAEHAGRMGMEAVTGKRRPAGVPPNSRCG